MISNLSQLEIETLIRIKDRETRSGSEDAGIPPIPDLIQKGLVNPAPLGAKAVLTSKGQEIVKQLKSQ